MRIEVGLLVFCFVVRAMSMCVLRGDVTECCCEECAVMFVKLGTDSFDIRMEVFEEWHEDGSRRNYKVVLVSVRRSHLGS